MIALDNLLALAAGAPPATGILGACRLESGNVDDFGIEAVGHAFQRAPLADAKAASTITAPGHAAIFTETEAIVADLHGDNIGRLWRIGQADPGTPEPAIQVAFDPDLHQAPGDVFMSAADHPALDPAALSRIIALGRALTDDRTPGFATARARVFAIRAFGDPASGCVLFAIHALAAGPVRTPLLTMAAARWDGTDTRIVRDPLRDRAGLVRIVT